MNRIKYYISLVKIKIIFTSPINENIDSKKSKNFRNTQKREEKIISVYSIGSFIGKQFRKLFHRIVRDSSLSPPKKSFNIHKAWMCTGEVLKRTHVFNLFMMAFPEIVGKNYF